MRKGLAPCHDCHVTAHRLCLFLLSPHTELSISLQRWEEGSLRMKTNAWKSHKINSGEKSSFFTFHIWKTISVELSARFIWGYKQPLRPRLMTQLITSDWQIVGVVSAAFVRVSTAFSVTWTLSHYITWQWDAGSSSQPVMGARLKATPVFNCGLCHLPFQDACSLGGSSQPLWWTLFCLQWPSLSLTPLSWQCPHRASTPFLTPQAPSAYFPVSCLKGK